MNSRRVANLTPQKLIIGLAGAPGISYGLHLLEQLRALAEVETYLIISPPARRNITTETRYTPAEVEALADKTYPFQPTSLHHWPELEQANGQIILPCGHKTVTDLVEKASHNLILQTAHQTLNRRARLVLLWHEPTRPAEHPHLLEHVKRLGAIIIPATPAATEQAGLIKQTVEQILACFNLKP